MFLSLPRSCGRLRGVFGLLWASWNILENLGGVPSQFFLTMGTLLRSRDPNVFGVASIRLKVSLQPFLQFLMRLASWVRLGPSWRSLEQSLACPRGVSGSSWPQSDQSDPSDPKRRQTAIYAVPLLNPLKPNVRVLCWDN